MAGQIGNLQIRIGADIGDLQGRMRAARQEVANAADVMTASLGRVDKSFRGTAKSAEDSASAFIAGRKAANDLISSIDPLYAAQQRYNAKLEEATTLLKNGSLTAEEFGKVQAGLKDQLAGTSQVYGTLTQGTGNARLAQMELLHSVRASVDMYAFGTPITKIFALQVAQVGQAAALAGGSMGKFGAILSSGWGIAAIAAISVLSTLIAKHKDAAESVDDLIKKKKEDAEKTDASRIADERWADSIGGLIQRNEDLIKTLKDRLKAQEDIALQELQAAQRDRVTAEKAVADAQKALNDLKAQQKTQFGPGAVGIGQGAAVSGVSESNLAQRIAAAESRLRDARRGLADTETAIRQATISVGEEEGKALADLSSALDLWAKRYTSALHGIEQANNGALAGSTGVITQAFESLKKAMGDAAGQGLSADFYNARTRSKDLGVELEKGKLSVADYAKAINELAKSLEAAAKAAQEAKKHTGSGLSGKQIGFAEATDIARGAGLVVTSGQRSFADQQRLYNTVRTAANPVARPGTSAHEGVNGKWALDIAFAPGLTPDKIRKIYGDQGVSLTALYKETGHFHIEGSRSQAAAAQAKQDRAAQKEQTDDDSFARQMAQLDAQILDARRQQFAGYDTQADLQTQEIEAQRQANEAAIQKQLDAQQIDAAQAEQLRLQNDDLAAAREAVVTHRKYLDGLKQIGELVDQQYQFQIDDLTFADQIAKTQAEHRRIELERLDIQMKQKEEDLKRLLLSIQSNKDFATSVDLQNQALQVQGQIARIPIERSQGQQQIIRNTQSPFEQWMQDAKTAAIDINASLETIEVKGLDGLTDALTDVITGTKSLRSAFHELALSILEDLVRMTIKMLLFKAISGIAGAIGGGSSGGGYDYATLDSSGIYGDLPGFATGGSFKIGGRGGTDMNILSINGIPRARVSGSETISVGNDNQAVIQPFSLTMHNDFRGADPAAIASIQTRLNQMEAELPSKVVATMTDARARFLWR